MLWHAQFCGRIVALILPVDLKYKGALLVLLWSTMMFSYEVLIGQYVIDNSNTDTPVADKIPFIAKLFDTTTVSSHWSSG